MGYTRSIRGVFMGYTYVSGMCRVCVGKVSKDTRRKGDSMDEHGWTRKRGICIDLLARKLAEI